MGDMPIGPMCMWWGIMDMDDDEGGVSSKGLEATMVSPRAKRRQAKLLM